MIFKFEHVGNQLVYNSANNITEAIEQLVGCADQYVYIEACEVGSFAHVDVIDGNAYYVIRSEGHPDAVEGVIYDA